MSSINRGRQAIAPGDVRVSFCINSHNEEDLIRNCLESIKGVADEIVVVDSSSTDNTAAIAREYTDKVYNIDRFYVWHHGDGAMKTYSADKASGNIIFHMDCDECLHNPEAMPGFKNKVSKSSDSIWPISIYTPHPEDGKDGNLIYSLSRYAGKPNSVEEGKRDCFAMRRVWRNNMGIKVHGYLHPQPLMPNGPSCPPLVEWCGFKIIHLKFFKSAPCVAERKYLWDSMLARGKKYPAILDHAPAWFFNEYFDGRAEDIYKNAEEFKRLTSLDWQSPPEVKK